MGSAREDRWGGVKTAEMEVDVCLKAPFTATVVGPTGSVKTRMILNLIEKADSLSSPPPNDIIYCYGAWQKLFESVSRRVIFHKGMLNVKEDIHLDGQTGG
jgi:hypothetical protein